MTATTSRGYAHKERRHVTVDHVAKTAFGFGFLAVALYEVGAPIFHLDATDAKSYFSAAVGLAFGGIFSLWK